MEGIDEYKVVSASSREGINEKVADAMRLGWKPLGGVSAATSKFNELALFQAMTR